MIRTLAEPNLTAISGETRDFPGRRRVSDSRRAGPATQRPAPARPRSQFKKFGVGLNFTPVVLSEGRISLKVMTEVSELSQRRCARSRQGSAFLRCASRRADTTVEIPSGGALAMAGMIQEQTKQQINGVPGSVAGAGPRHAVQEPRLRQPPDRTGGAGDALRRARGCAEGSLAAR